jgi:hypothetical protein
MRPLIRKNKKQKNKMTVCRYLVLCAAILGVAVVTSFVAERFKHGAAHIDSKIPYSVMRDGAHVSVWRAVMHASCDCTQRPLAASIATATSDDAEKDVENTIRTSPSESGAHTLEVDECGCLRRSFGYAYCYNASLDMSLFQAMDNFATVVLTSARWVQAFVSGQRLCHVVIIVNGTDYVGGPLYLGVDAAKTALERTFNNYFLQALGGGELLNHIDT